MEEISNQKITIASLKKNEKGIITNFDADAIPLKIIELGCMVGSEVKIIEKASFGDPIYLQLNDVFLSIRKEMASLIEIEKI